ncbi:MAG: glycosyltransferase family 2 protein [Cyclobacteriaceae bacterium]|nr:MAG: glycosyltransferase family 2 protein [Cyclobacteriaceae bacterium]
MIELILFVFFFTNTLYVFTLSAAGHFYHRIVPIRQNSYKRIAVFVPSYKEDNVIIHTAKELLEVEYPESFFDVIIIADSLKEETLEQLRKTRAIVIPVQFEKSMKSRSLNFAFNSVNKEYDIAIIADADNILEREFLSDINNLFNQGHQIIQAQRVAKNLNTPMAVLDGLSEAINNHLFRQGANALGLSSALIGSGMAFPFNLLKKELSTIDSAVEDKALQVALVEKGHKIVYQKGTLVFDEKVDSPDAYKNQRRRWIAGQYDMLRKNFIKGIRLLFRGNVNFFNIAVCQNIFPSRINSIIALFFLSITFSLFYSEDKEVLIRWWGTTSLYFFALAIATPRHYYSLKLIKALTLMPIVIIKTIQAIFLSRNANKTFIHTEHKNSNIDHTYLPK